MSVGDGIGEIIDIEVRGDSRGLEETAKELKHIEGLLVKFNKTLGTSTSASAEAQKSYNNLANTLNKLYIKNLVQYFDKLEEKIEQEAAAADAAAKQNAALQRSINNLNKESLKFGKDFNMMTRSGRESFKAWKKDMDKNIPFLMKPKSREHIKNNIRIFKEAINDSSRVGIANISTLKALETGISGTFTRSLTSVDRFNLKIGTVKRNMDGFFRNMRLRGKDLQWTGMQMMQGITIPILGFGALAVREFTTVNKQMLQLKKVTEFKSDYDELGRSIKDMSDSFAISRGAMTGLYRDIAALGIEGTENIEKWAEEISKISVLGDMEIGAATDFVRSISAIFDDGNMEKTPELLAQMNAVADETSLQLGDLAQAFPEVAPTMKQMGFEAGGVAAALAAMYKQGIPATEGAHALKHGMTALIDPTKDAKAIIDDLGFSFYNMEGKASNGTLNLLSLAKSLAEKTNEERAKAVSEMFGGRQSARFNALVDDMTLGWKQIEAAQADGEITLKESQDFTSDWARSLVATGDIVVKDMESVGARYERAMDNFRKDPSFELEKLKVGFRGLLVDLGAFIVPPLNAMLKRIKGFFDSLMQMPNFVKVGVGAILILASALGPITYAFAQAQNAVATFGIVAAKVIPKGFKDINGAAAFMKLLKENPMREDIVGWDGKVVQLTKRAAKRSEAKLAKEGIERLTKAQLENMAAQYGLEQQIEKTNADIVRQAVVTKANTKATQEDTMSKLVSAVKKKPASMFSTENVTAGLAAESAESAGPAAATGIFAKLGNVLKNIVPLFAKFAKFTWIAAAITAAVLLLKKAFDGLKENWDTVVSKMEPGLNALKTAWENIKKAVQVIIEKFGQVFNQLGGGDNAQATLGFWETVGNFISQASIVIAYAMDLISKAIEAAWPIFEGFAYAVKDVVGFVASLFKGDWKNAMLYLAAFAYEGIRPVIMIFELLVNIVLWAVKAIMSGLEWLSRGFEEMLSWVGINTTGMSDFFKSLGDGLQSLADENMVEYFDKNLRNLPSVFDDATGEAIPDEVNEEGQQNINDFTNDASDAIADGLNEDMKDKISQADWFKDFLSAAKSRIQEQVDEVKDAAIKALESAQEAEMKYYDDKLQQIEDIEKAEEKLYQEQEYLQKKREMLAKRAIDVQNYQRNRALAIYEGRIDDARMLDLEHEKSTTDFNKDMSDLESDRQKELVKDARDAQKEAIEIEKTALKERQDAFMEYFKKQLDILTQYTPRTIGEFQNMVSSITGLLSSGGASWTESAQTAGLRMSEALRRANEDIRQDFSWSGKDAMMSWMAAFISPDVIQRLIANMSQTGTDAGNALRDGLKGGLDTAAAELDTFTKDTPGKLEEMWINMIPSWDFNWEEMGRILGEKMDIMETRFWNGIERIKQWFGGIPEWIGHYLDTIEEAFGEIPGWLGGLIEKIEYGINAFVRTLRVMANSAIGMVNKLIDGYNVISSKIPGMSTLTHIDYLQGPDIASTVSEIFRGYGSGLGFATGGITSGPTLAGEGSYPEFVIPTDPRYKSNALALTSQLNQTLGLRSKQPNIPSGQVTGGGGYGTIYVDTFIGEEEWFKNMADKYDMKVGKRKAINSGSQTRVVSKYNQNDRGKF